MLAWKRWTSTPITRITPSNASNLSTSQGLGKSDTGLQFSKHRFLTQVFKDETHSIIYSDRFVDGFGCGKRKTTPPPEVPTEVSELEIDFGDEFMPIEDENDGFDISIGE